jgi:fatty acid CoA ligase FadD21
MTHNPDSSLVAVLRERAEQRPNQVVFRYTDYEQDWDGLTTDLTWEQLYRRSRNLAHDIMRKGAVGDRALILAPQGLDYIVAFLGAIQAGLIAVPLSVPAAGKHDDRVNAVLADTGPTVILTTSAVSSVVREYAQRTDSAGPVAVVDVDSLDLDDTNSPHIQLSDAPSTAYLQYTSGSTRAPAGVMVSHRNLQENFVQLMAGYFAEFDSVLPPETALVSWLPFYHDLGLMLGIIGPILDGRRAELTSPIAFLQQPSRWIQSLSIGVPVFSAAPNFAFDLAIRTTTDADLEGVDLSNVLGIVNGAERVNPGTLDRFCKRFAGVGFRERMIRPAYGLAEATLYVATRNGPPRVIAFDPDKLSEGIAEPSSAETGTPLLSYGIPTSPLIRIVDPDSRTECPQGTVGEIWVHGDNVSEGYWENPEETDRTFGGTLKSATPETSERPWLRTGDLGFISAGELFIVGRMKDIVIVYGRNHYPEDIESTVQKITGGRVAAISVSIDDTEKLVTVVEIKKRGATDEEAQQQLDNVKKQVTKAIMDSHGITVADLVLVGFGSIPTTTSGKISRTACGQRYREQAFARLDA